MSAVSEMKSEHGLCKQLAQIYVLLVSFRSCDLESGNTLGYSCVNSAINCLVWYLEPDAMVPFCQFVGC